MTQAPAPYPEEGNYLQQPGAAGENTLAKWAFGLSVASALSIVVIGPFALLPGLVAFVLGIVALVKAKKFPTPKQKRKGFSIAAVVISVLVMLVSAAALYFAAISFAKCQDAPNTDAMRQCIEHQFGA